MKRRNKVKQNRFKSPILWSSLAALILMVMRFFGLGEAADTASQKSAEIFGLVCAVLAALGIINNPSEGDKF